MRVKTFAVMGILAMAACARVTEEPVSPAEAAAAPAGPAESTAPVPADECGAAQYQALIGKKKADIPPTPPGTTWCVACTSCPVTMDLLANRLNIFINEKTEVIEQVKCG
jgi:hypothetical protein